jgi:hypothetical protein
MGDRSRFEIINRLAQDQALLARLLLELCYMGADGHPRVLRAMDAWLNHLAPRTAEDE